MTKRKVDREVARFMDMLVKVRQDFEALQQQAEKIGLPIREQHTSGLVDSMPIRELVNQFAQRCPDHADTPHKRGVLTRIELGLTNCNIATVGDLRRAIAQYGRPTAAHSSCPFQWRAMYGWGRQVLRIFVELLNTYEL